MNLGNLTLCAPYDISNLLKHYIMLHCRLQLTKELMTISDLFALSLMFQELCITPRYEPRDGKETLA